MAFLPSPQQQAYFDWIDADTGSAVLEAVAGSGKTTTLIRGLERMRGDIFFGAFNKKIAEEIKTKVKLTNVTVSTMHGAGYRAWSRVARGAKVEPHKVRGIFRDAVSRNPQYEPFESAVLQLVSCAKQAGFNAVCDETRKAWLDLIDHFGVEIPDDNVTLAIALCHKTLVASVALDYKIIDFDDQIYAPLLHKTHVPEYDWVLIDEAQDTNAVRRALALRMLKRGGRMVAVGDRWQAVYGFTGADANALDLVASAVNAKLLPLTVTYRCPKAVVAYAHQWVSHIQAHESAPEGVVRTLAEPVTAVAKPGDAILCRFNAPLLPTAFALIAAGVPAKIEGREIGSELKTLARRWKVTAFPALEDKLDDYLERQTAKFRAKEQESKAVAVEDKVGCLRVLIARVQAKGFGGSAIEALCAEIDALFGEVTNGQVKEVVLLSTIHKSKGREWKRVFWLQTGPSKWARKDWELRAETCLNYVAATRAMSELILVPQA